MIAYEENGKVYLAVVLDDSLLPENYIPIETSPTEPDITWYIEDGQIKIDQAKLIEFNRQNMPTLSPIEFDLKLNKAGLYDAVQELIKDNFELRIAYTRAIFFSRVDPFVLQASEALNLTPEQVDEIWTA